VNASRSVRAAAIAAVVLAAVACGDSGDADGEATRPEGPPPALAEYVARADALCAEVLSEHPEIAEGARELRRLSPSDPGFRRKAATHFREVLAVARSARTEFEALEPPDADRERIEQFHDANAEAVARLEDLIEALEGRDDPDAAGEAYVRALAKADRLADAYGFEVCGRISGE
jgi:hypothetical protein